MMQANLRLWLVWCSTTRVISYDPAPGLLRIVLKTSLDSRQNTHASVSSMQLSWPHGHQMYTSRPSTSTLGRKSPNMQLFMRAWTAVGFL